MEQTIIPGLEDKCDEPTRVLRWRVSQLVAAGFDVSAAARLASESEVDLHHAVELVARGCSPAIATRILL